MKDHEKLKKLYEEIDGLVNTAAADNPEFITWHTKAERFLEKKFGETSKEAKEFEEIHFSPMVWTSSMTEKDEIYACTKGLIRAKSVFSVYIEEMEEEIENEAVRGFHEANTDAGGMAFAGQKKYQVFISSTYEDLKEERNAVQKLLLEMDCIPAGMEQFPASNMSQMSFIEKMLDDCDYYILILAGKYGSLDADGVGFTEKEYDYAVSHGIPVLSFVVEDINKLALEKCERDSEKAKRLSAFRKKVMSGKLVKKYNDIGNLAAGVAISLQNAFKTDPSKGWVRGTVDRDADKRMEAIAKKSMEEMIATDEEVEKMLEEIFGASL